MRKSTANHISSKLFSSVMAVIWGIGFLFVFSMTSSAQQVRSSDYKADQALKSNARVNPTTQAMELSIPIGGYGGRAGNGLPLVFNYSSKVWQIQVLYTWEGTNGIKTDTRPMYGKRTAAGWTSNLGVPRIDYTLGIYEGFHEGSQYEGQAWTQYVGIDPDPNPPNYALYYVKRLQVVMPDGSSHEFRKDDTTHSYGSNNSPGGPGLPDQAGTFLSVDGSKMRLEVGTNDSTLYLPDGSRYLFGPQTAQHLAYAMIDRHGNKMTYDAANKRWTDTMGRIVDDPMPMNWDNFQQSQVVQDKVANFPSFNGSTLDVTFSWRPLKDPNGGESGLEDTSQQLNNLSNIGCQGNINRQIPAPYLFTNPEPSIARVCNPIGWVGMNWTIGAPFNPVVLTKITMPNGQKYEFKYNVYGEIIKIIYPTGAYERFLYGQAPTVQPQGVTYDQANRGVTERWVSAKGDGTDELHWTYNTGTVTAPDGTKTQKFVYTEQIDAPQPFGFGNVKTGFPYEERVLSPTNQILRRKLTGYEVSGPQTGGYADATRDLRQNKEISIIIEPGASYALAQMSETIYDTNSDPQYFAQLNPKQVKTYNFIVLDLTTAQNANINTISALFSSSSLANTTEIDYLYNGDYKARNITGLVTETRTKDAAGNVKAKTQISYDESGYSLASTGTMPTGAANSWVDPTVELGSVLGSRRGLPTTARSFSDISANFYVETHSFYDQYGNLRKSRDGRNNDSETEYDDDYAFAYPTLVKTPVPDNGTNGSNSAFITTSIYDFITGLPTSITDPNAQTSTMQYNDALLRPTKAIAPNGQETITEYGAGTSAATRFIKVKTQIDATKWKEASSWFDGLGRTVKTQSMDSNGDVFVETEYDNMGRVKKVSNPYRTGETIYKTENFYDDLGRVTKVKSPDNAEVLTAFSLATSGSQIGTVVTATDQSFRSKRSITNALGQIIRVDEPNDSNLLGTIDSPAQSTAYSYDTLSNLITVNQGIQTRNFVYDSLSRLKQAANPESGTISYSYDNNGNLTQKIDARGVVTTLAYDNLNRVKTRTFSNEPGGQTPTPAVTYYYDGIYFNAQNSQQAATGSVKGKLTSVSSSLSRTNYTSFDNLGRILQSQQITDGTAYNPMTYTYNLSGGLIEQTYPSGRVVKNTFDSDGDLAQVESSKTQTGSLKVYANNFTYTAAGAVSSVRLGNGRWESTQFNSRLQPIQIALGTSQGLTNQLKLDYEYGALNLGTGQVIAGTNNGNVAKQTITVQNTPTANGFSATQYYDYDSLNRIKTASENLTPNGQTTYNSWQQNFTYDRYGNRNFVEATTTTLPKNCSNGTQVCPADRKVLNPSISASNNRLVQDQDGDSQNDYVFDASGNTTKDALVRTFIYDAENKQTEVKDSQNTSIGQYFYDGDGKRIKKVSATETTIFIYDASGKMVAEYSTIVANQTNAKVSYMTNDHLGSPRINTDANGVVISRHDYQPFGEEITRASYGSDTIRKKFTSYERDLETDLDFAKARYYNKNLGRFTSVDPISITSYRLVNPQTLNLYSYVANAPLKFTDPTGKDIRFKNKEDADKGLIYYQNGLTKSEQKYLSIQKNKDGTFSLNVNEKAGKEAKQFSALSRLYNAANGTPQIAMVSFVTKDTKFSMTTVSADGKSTKKETSLAGLEKESKGAVTNLAGLTLFPVESRAKAQPKDGSPSAFSSEANTTQIIVATDNAEFTPTQAIYAETLAHFGELVRTGNPRAAIHADDTSVDIIEEGVVEEAGRNEQANKAATTPGVKKPQ